jgi:hypothetical protein
VNRQYGLAPRHPGSPDETSRGLTRSGPSSKTFAMHWKSVQRAKAVFSIPAFAPCLPGVVLHNMQRFCDGIVFCFLVVGPDGHCVD